MDNKKRTWESLAIHGQDGPHGEAAILATRGGLELLRMAINEALARGAARIEGNIHPGDGECYHTYIAILTGVEIEQVSAPYTDREAFSYKGSNPVMEAFERFNKIVEPKIIEPAWLSKDEYEI